LINIKTATQDLSEASKIRIGEITLDVQKSQVTVAGTTNQIEPRLVRVLVALCENAGEVVSRDDLLAAVSSLPFAGDESLTQAISKLRTILGDKSKTPKYIKTIPRQGYLLVASVDVIDASYKEVASYAIQHSRKLLIVMAIILVVITVTLVALWPKGNSDIEFIEKKDIEFYEREEK